MLIKRNPAISNDIIVIKEAKRNQPVTERGKGSEIEGKREMEEQDMRKAMDKRIMALVLAILLVPGLLPGVAFGQEPGRGSLGRGAC